MTKKIVCFLFTILSLTSLIAQVQEKIEPENIRTIQFRGGTQQSQLPIIRLGETLQLSFDDIIGNEADYYYTITHFNFDWTESDLSKGEYLSGFDDVRIETYENSLSTLQLFSHYTVTIPNRETRSISKSGNYLLSIFDDDGYLVFTRKFMVIENQVGVRVEVKRSRNLKFIEEKQVVQFTVASGQKILINPKPVSYTHLTLPTKRIV